MAAFALGAMNAGMGAGADAAIMDVELLSQAGMVEVRHSGRPLAVYQFKAAPFKPYLRSLHSLSGVNVLLDGPSDHLHHHGLMYAVKVNGVNFWEEAAGSGYQLSGPEISRRVTRDRAGRPVAELAHQVFWVPTNDVTDRASSAWMIEDRSLVFTIDAAAREVSVEWKSSFTIGPAIEEATVGGAAYNGLGLRLTPAFDHTAGRRNGSAGSYTQEATWDVTQASWASTTQTINNHPITVSIFHNPTNTAEPRFFSMLNPFAYLSATQGLDTRPIVYRRGQKFALHYLVTVHARDLSAEETAARHGAWLKTDK
jgi:hypothetical protein